MGNLEFENYVEKIEYEFTSAEQLKSRSWMTKEKAVGVEVAAEEAVAVMAELLVVS